MALVELYDVLNSRILKTPSNLKRAKESPLREAKSFKKPTPSALYATDTSSTRSAAKFDYEYMSLSTL